MHSQVPRTARRPSPALPSAAALLLSEYQRRHAMKIREYFSLTMPTSSVEMNGLIVVTPNRVIVITNVPFNCVADERWIVSRIEPLATVSSVSPDVG
jgi:hypothetical protein